MMLKYACSLAALGAAAAVFAAGPIEIKKEQVERVRHRDVNDSAVKVNYANGAVSLMLKSAEWSSGVKINPPEGKKFDFSDGKFLAVDVENLSKTDQMRLTMHISSGKPGAGGSSHVDLRMREVNTGIALNPGEKRTMRLFLPHRSVYEAPEGTRNLKVTLDTAQINNIQFQLQWPFEPNNRQVLVDCKLSNFRLEGEAPAVAVKDIKNYTPFVDRYGQYVHSEWPEKITSDKQLVENRIKESAELEKAGRPATWNEFGGWANGPQLEATGAFRTEKYQGKWFLVDPKGKLFWSTGIDVLRITQDSINTAKHPTWYTGRGVLDFNGVNNRKKYSSDAAFYETLNKRLAAWGINTVGNWASGEFLQTGKTPYTLGLYEYSDWNKDQFAKFTKEKVKFYDVFDPSFEERMGNILRDRAKTHPDVKKSINDPMCIGYFIDNELQAGKVRAAIIKADPKQPAKVQFVKDLEEKYKNIDALNKAWNTSYADFKDILDINATVKGDGFRKDMDDFQTKFFDRYFEICRKGIKSIAPDRLYLGCRFVGFGRDHNPALIWKSAAKFCDIVSVNTYTPSIYHHNQDQLHGKPLLIGEYHFGTYDRGMFSPSLAPVGTQEERAMSLLRYNQGALVLPDVVGVHYFQFRDQPLTGRGDGEGYQIGFVDVADTPYDEFCKTAREIGENMYQYRLDGKLKNEMK